MSWYNGNRCHYTSRCEALVEQRQEERVRAAAWKATPGHTSADVDEHGLLEGECISLRFAALY